MILPSVFMEEVGGSQNMERNRNSKFLKSHMKNWCTNILPGEVRKGCGARRIERITAMKQKQLCTIQKLENGLLYTELHHRPSHSIMMVCVALDNWTTIARLRLYPERSYVAFFARFWQGGAVPYIVLYSSM